MDGARIHPSADVDERAEVGLGTTVWHLAQIRENARLGGDCIVARGAHVGPSYHAREIIISENVAETWPFSFGEEIPLANACGRVAALLELRRHR